MLGGTVAECYIWKKFFSKKWNEKGGVLSPYLFTTYVCDLVASVVQTGIAGAIDNTFTHILAYADDMILLAHSGAALQKLTT